jgi:hypothetical protein
MAKFLSRQERRAEHFHICFREQSSSFNNYYNQSMALEGANEILSVFSDVIQHAWREAPEGYCDTDFSAPSKTGKVHYKCMVSLLAFSRHSPNLRPNSNECKRRKVKCSGGTVCQRCTSFGIECIYLPSNEVVHRGPE